MTSLRAALTDATNFDLESNETRIQHLRAEAKRRLETASNADDGLAAICRLIFEILNLQDEINRDRYRISTLKS
jgi:hypothetical protein